MLMSCAVFCYAEQTWEGARISDSIVFEFVEIGIHLFIIIIIILEC